MRAATLLVGCLLGLPLLLAADAQEVGPFLTVASHSGGTNLLRNAGFEARAGESFPSWSSAPQGYRVAPGEGREGSLALAAEAADTTGWRGASQSLTLNRKTAAPLTVRGWSRAEAVSGGTDNDYSLYVDLIYTDGTPLWGQTANFSTGTHDWQSRELRIVPEKPVRALTIYGLFRNHSGRVWFDDLSVEELTADGEAFVFQGTAMTLGPVTNAPTPPPADTERATGDGLRLGLQGSRVVSVQLDGRELAAPGGGAGGFLVRDVAGDSNILGFTNGICAALGLRLETTVTEHPDHLAWEGTLTNTRGGDRAILLLFALPLDGTGWTWNDDVRRQRPISGSGEYFTGTGIGNGSTGAMSTYPLAAVHDARSGLALGLDLAHPAVYRLVYHAGSRQFFLAFDFGLVPETIRFPDSAHFRFVLYRFEPRWGFRAALDKFTRLFPEHYRVRSSRQGIWMPFTDVSTVTNWQDFGFRYHEGDNNVAWDDRHDVLSFRYTEPMTWWMSMNPSLPRTEAAALEVRDALAQGPAGSPRNYALVSRSASMEDVTGHPPLLFRNEPWANGAVWSLNPNPYLPADPNAATLHWNDASRRRYQVDQPTHLDGEYLDSLEGYVTADLNYRRDHFGSTTVPLTFATDSFRPALFKGLAIHEFTRWISDDVHRLGGLMFANGVPYRFGWLCPWLDVLGTETDWMSGTAYTPVADSQLCLWRSLAGRKPYLLLMNTDFAKFTSEHVQRYFQRALAYGMYPSMFSQNASENPYWQNPAWYNRDRPLFKKYLPIIREVAEAGWQPVTAATFAAGDVAMERFGTATNTAVYLTLLNDAEESRTGVLHIDSDVAEPSAVATELVSGQPLPRAASGWTLTVAARATAAVKLEPGPRFIGIEPFVEPGNPSERTRLHLTVHSPVGLEQFLESSHDLVQWTVLLTNRPAASPYPLDVAPAAEPSRRFLRLRW